MRVLLPLLVTLLLAAAPQAWAEMLEGMPLNYAGGCALDLDLDGKGDLAMLVTLPRGETQLVVLMARGEGYEAFVAARDVGNLLLTCQWGESVTESQVVTEEGREPRTYELNGNYLRLTLPESFSAVYFWRDGKFVEAVTAD